MSRHSNLYRKLRRDSTETAKNRQTPQKLCRLERRLQDSDSLVQGVASRALESKSTCRARNCTNSWLRIPTQAEPEPHKEKDPATARVGDLSSGMELRQCFRKRQSLSTVSPSEQRESARALSPFQHKKQRHSSCAMIPLQFTRLYLCWS